MESLSLEAKNLEELAHAKIHFGKYKNQYISDIPETYLLWFKQKGFPENKLGKQMQEVLELKTNGLEDILWKIRRK